MNNRDYVTSSRRSSGDLLMTCGNIVPRRLAGRYSISLALPVVIAASFGVAGAASAQQQAPAAKPPAAPKPAAPKPAVPPTAPGAPQPTLLGQFGDWGAYTATPGGKKVCFALAKPTNSSTSPPNRPRDPTYMFVPSRPAEKVKEEVSIIFGYGLKPNADANGEVAGASYAMYTQADDAWVKNVAEEIQLVDTMSTIQEPTVR